MLANEYKCKLILVSRHCMQHCCDLFSFSYTHTLIYCFSPIIRSVPSVSDLMLIYIFSSRLPDKMPTDCLRAVKNFRELFLFMLMVRTLFYVFLNVFFFFLSFFFRSLSRRSKSIQGMDEQKSNCEENDSEPTGTVFFVELGLW